MSCKASIVRGVIPLSEAQANLDLKPKEQAHNIAKMMGRWKKRLRHTEKTQYPGCQHIKREADRLAR